MGKGGEKGGESGEAQTRSYTWEEIQKHNLRTDKWLVIERKVYNVTQWADRHPGGHRVISHCAGEDATDAFQAFHINPTLVQKFLKPLLIGELAPGEPSQDRDKNSQLVEDFRTLRKTAEDMNLFRANPLFFSLYLGHIIAMEVLAWLMVSYFGTGWITTLILACILTTSQAQAGWLQHDFGHLSVFKKSSWNHIVHKFIIGHLKGASANWWNHRHFQHHAKPNIFEKDPDVNMLHIFVLGDTQPVEYGKKKLKYLPYNHQHEYFFLIFPPLLIPVYFQIQIISTMIRRRFWADLAWAISYYMRYFITYIPFYGVLGSLSLLTFVRFLESHWFVWVTQMNHIPMEIDCEKHRDWLSSQVAATCNIEQSFFNDWFTGHLNFQIEHHLFPTMPRHNFWKVKPLVKSLCAKYGVQYEEKPLGKAFVDIIGSLKKSGDLWLDAYLHNHIQSHCNARRICFLSEHLQYKPTSSMVHNPSSILEMSPFKHPKVRIEMSFLFFRQTKRHHPQPPQECSDSASRSHQLSQEQDGRGTFCRSPTRPLTERRDITSARCDKRKARARVRGSNYKKFLTVIGSSPNQPASLGVFMGFMSALVRAVALPFYQKSIEQILKLFQVPSMPNNIPDQESTSGEEICE